MPHPRLETYGSSDIGNVRANNEDAWAALPGFPFFALADGMGGHKAGEIASKEAIEDLCQSLHQFLHPKKEMPLSLSDIIHHIHKGFLSANKRIYQLSKEFEGFRGMGTTLCCYLFHEEKIIFAHVGDSRIYHIRKDKIEQLTEDHSLAKEMLSHHRKKSDLPPPYHHVITRAIGTTSDVVPEISSIEVEEGDIFLMCSDGLSDFLLTEEILATVHKMSSIKMAVKKLIQKAKRNGSTDNITLVMTKVEALDD